MSSELKKTHIKTFFSYKTLDNFLKIEKPRTLYILKLQ